MAPGRAHGSTVTSRSLRTQLTPEILPQPMGPVSLHSRWGIPDTYHLPAGPPLKISPPQHHLTGDQAFSAHTTHSQATVMLHQCLSSTMLYPAPSSLEPRCHHKYHETSKGVSKKSLSCAGVTSGSWVVLSPPTAAEASLLVSHWAISLSCALWWDINSSWAPQARWLWALLPWAFQSL